MFVDHTPQGNPCSVCGESAFIHRVEHRPQGNPCTICGLSPFLHRLRPNRKQASKERTIFLGIDGEGIGRNPHKYVLIGAADEDDNRQWWVENYDGLNTDRSLDFILNLPQHNTKTFAFAFNYDLTMLLADLPDQKLYLLFHPELRQRHGEEAMKGPYPVRWNGFEFNMQGTKFTVRKKSRYRVIWDIWKFYQASFVNALKEWKVGNEELWERMQKMKDARSVFTEAEQDRIRKYCLEECVCMAKLSRKLVEAHEGAGLKLKSFYGAGSTAAAMLTKMGIKEKIVAPPKDMMPAVARAFFGGRFENSVIGILEEPIFNYDISSAYPYQLCFMPCLLHGKWEYTTDRRELESPLTRASLVHYALPQSNDVISSWGPFPFREATGSICFPSSSGGGWVWDEEYLQGEKMFPNVEFIEAWVYKSVCTCTPFNDIPKYYLERLKIGKEGPGIVIKLGMNSNYGKLAQGVGKGQFNSWVWAGLITSRTRAQLLRALECTAHENVYMMATDGVFSNCELNMPKPKDTGTDIEVFDQVEKKLVRKPLGGWEKTLIPQGIFIARPGIYFPLNPTEKDLKKVKARGLGKKSLYDNHKHILNHWATYGHYLKVQVSNIQRFCGAKSSIHRAGPLSQYRYSRASAGPERGTANGASGIAAQSQSSNNPHSGQRQPQPAAGAPAYGQWVTRPVEMSFNPMPKRETVNKDGRTLKMRGLGYSEADLPPGVESMPYKKIIKSMERMAMEAMKLMLEEQPDMEFHEIEEIE